MTAMPNIELTVFPAHPDDSCWVYKVCWNDGDVLIRDIPETVLDLIPFIVARKLLSQGYNTGRLLIVRLRGSDRDLMRAPLGAVAATPLVNTAAPVERATHAIYRERHR
jgi:hypothetical protein